MVLAFRCALCARKTRIRFFGPVPRHHRPVCPPCWPSMGVGQGELKRAARAKIEAARRAQAGGEVAYARCLALEARNLIERYRRAREARTC